MPENTPEAPQVTPTVQAEPAPPPNLVSTILGLISEPAGSEVPKGQESSKIQAPSLELGTPKAQEPAVIETPPAPAQEPKVAVTKKSSGPSTDEIIRKTVEELRRSEAPAPSLPQFDFNLPAVVPEAPTVESISAQLGFELSPEEKEELDLALYAEQVDQSRAGLSDKLAKFYKDQKEFFDKKTAEDPDYDPDSDPEYKKFITKANPRFTSAEKRKIELRREVEAAEKRAYERAKRDIMPEIEETRRKLARVENAPEIDKAVGAFSKSVFSGSESEALKAYSSASDANAFRADYPAEADLIIGAQKAAEVAAKEFLAIRRGIVSFDPDNNKDHASIASFIDRQGEMFATHGGDARVRNGKVFVPPSKWSPEIEDRAWTFSDQDVLNALRVHTRRTIEKQLASEQKRFESIQEAKARRTRGTTPTGAAPAHSDTNEIGGYKPVRSGVSSVSAAGSATEIPEKNIASRILGLST